MEKSKIIKLIITIACSVLFGVIAFISYGTGVCFPIQKIELNNVADVARDDKGNCYVLNNGGYELLRINSNHKIDLVIKGLRNTDSSFERGLHLAVDDMGNIYVHNRIASEQAASWIGRENVLVYDSSGKYLFTSCDIQYDVPKLRSNIVSLKNLNGEVFAFYTDEQGVMTENVNNCDVSLYPFPEANKYIASICSSVTGDWQYATTKDGKIVRLDHTEYSILFETQENETESGYFSDIAVDENDTIYVCDAREGVVKALNDGDISPVFSPLNTIYQLDYYHGFAYNETYSVVMQRGRNYETISVCSLSGLAMIRGIVFWLFFGLLILSLCYLVYFLFSAIIKCKSSKVKILFGLSLIIAVLTGVFCMLVAKDYTSILSEKVIERASLNAQLVNNLINPEDFREIDSVTDFGGQAYTNIKEIVDNVILDGGKIPGDLYLVMYTLEEDGTVIERYSLEESQCCNFPYVWSDGTDERTVYETAETFSLTDANDAEGTFLCIYSPIEDEKGSVIGVIEVGTDVVIFEKEIQERIINFAVGVVAIAVVLILLVLELIEFVEAKKGIVRSDIKSGKTMPPLKLYRVVVFVIFFVTNITTPFLSIYALSLSDNYSIMTGIPAEILAAVPISAEVLFGAIFSMLGGSIIARLGIRKAGILGGMLFIVGLTIRFFYPDLLVLTIGNALQGAGWGISLLIVNSRIASENDAGVQEQGFTDYNIALQNGMNSGIVLGGFLLSFVNYSTMLIIAAFLSIIILLFSYFYIFNGNTQNALAMKDTEPKEKGVMSYIRFIFSPKVLVYFLCIVVPVIAASYYLNFLYPILGDRLGMSENNIGYSYLINGIVIICFGNLIENFMSRFFNRKVLLLIASLLYLVTFAIVGMFNSIPALLISLILLGVSDSFGYVVQSTFYTELEETKKFGYEKAMGVYSLFENLSQSAGSFIFGYILTIGVKVGMIAYGIIIGACAVLFVMVVVLIDKLHK